MTGLIVPSCRRSLKACNCLPVFVLVDKKATKISMMFVVGIGGEDIAHDPPNISG